jgi:molybdopterin-guanine dinucleotide biosynthesis protein A
MGTDKALLGSPPWAVRVATALVDAGCSPVLFVGGDPVLAGHGHERVADDEPGAGPLAALVAVQRRWPARTLVVAACDLPELSAAEVRPLIDAAAESSTPSAAVYRVEGEHQWSLAVLDAEVAARVVGLVGHGRRALRELEPWVLSLAAPAGRGVLDIDDPDTAAARGLAQGGPPPEPRARG